MGDFDHRLLESKHSNSHCFPNTDKKELHVKLNLSGCTLYRSDESHCTELENKTNA